LLKRQREGCKKRARNGPLWGKRRRSSVKLEDVKEQKRAMRARFVVSSAVRNLLPAFIVAGASRGNGEFWAEALEGDIGDKGVNDLKYFSYCGD
jgi:hypothetical protein